MKTFFETLLTEKFLESFWFEIEQKRLKTKKITERDCQRIFILCLRCYYSKFFTKMISDIPGISASCGYDIYIVTPETKIYLEAKIYKKAKIQNSQEQFKNEVQGFDFIEYLFIFFDIENKKIIIKK